VHSVFDSFPGAKRSLGEQIEGMDQCIASRKLLEPEIRGWLSGVKIPKPAKAEKATPAKATPAKGIRKGHR
jgi:hypothetical protein